MPPRNLPFPPMEAELVTELPEGDWHYEPKWDGFRGVMENLKGELAVWSRNARPLLRYFPELREVGELLPPDSALDGEIVIERDGRLDFDAMQTRLHPAESRIRKLSAEIPAQYVVFDLLLWDGERVWKRPLEERRAELEAHGDGFRLSPFTRELEPHRFRHGTRFLRFRPDKDPKECTWRQVRPRRRRDDPTVGALLAG